MKILIEHKDFNDKFSLLQGALANGGKDISNFMIDRPNGCIQIMIEDWCLQLNDDSTWEIS